MIFLVRKLIQKIFEYLRILNTDAKNHLGIYLLNTSFYDLKTID